MAELSYEYGAMGSGKSKNLIDLIDTYAEQLKRTIQLKPATDTRSTGVTSRNGETRPCITFTQQEDLFKLIANYRRSVKIDLVLIDEGQFMTVEHVRQLRLVTTKMDIPVKVYGLKIDYKGQGFDASKELFILADKITEIEVTCACGAPATMQLLQIDGVHVFNGDSVRVGDNEFTSVCPKCWYRQYDLTTARQKHSDYLEQKDHLKYKTHYIIKNEGEIVAYKIYAGLYIFYVSPEVYDQGQTLGIIEKVDSDRLETVTTRAIACMRGRVTEYRIQYALEHSTLDYLIDTLKVIPNYPQHFVLARHSRGKCDWEIAVDLTANVVEPLKIGKSPVGSWKNALPKNHVGVLDCICEHLDREYANSRNLLEKLLESQGMENPIAPVLPVREMTLTPL